jgi:signal peptidase I
MRVALLVGALLLTGCSSDRDVHVYRVPSSSMEPTLHCERPQLGCEGKSEDHVAVRPYGATRRPARGDIAVFRTPAAASRVCGSGGLFIKRVIGLPGDRWSERAGTILIDGKPLVEPYVARANRDTESFPGGRIPTGRYLLLGDNRSSSCDSRVWGLVRAKNLVGRVFEVKRGSKRIDIR